MQITIKTLKGETFQVEVQANETILNLKDKIKQLKGFDVDSQKIVFKGKATNNTDEISAIGVKEGDFLVFMALTKKPQPAKKEQEKQQKPAQESKQKPINQPINEQKKQNKVQPSNGDIEEKITYLTTMGFPRDQCQLALKAAFNNSDRAVEYLLNGIPSNTQNTSGITAELGQQLLAGLLMNPQFAQIRQMIRNDPSCLPTVLQEISQSSPQLYNLISQNPQAFERLILQGEDGDDSQQMIDAPPGSIVVAPEQQQAINRLANLGFSKIEAAQAYFACDKNEQMAANLLFDRLANGDIEQDDGINEEPPNQGDEDDDNLFN